MKSKRVRIPAWLSFAFLAVSFLLYVGVVIPTLLYANTSIVMGEKSFSVQAFFRPNVWVPLAPLVLLAVSLICAALLSVRAERKPGLAALIFSAAAAGVYWLMPSQTFMPSLYLIYRSFAGINWIPLVQRAGWVFPLFRWFFLAGFLLLITAIFLIPRRPSPTQS